MSLYWNQVIRSFKDRNTERLWNRETVPGLPPHRQRVALRKLRQVDAAGTLFELRIPPGNRLEALAGNRRGQHSIRTDRRWRICFAWKDGGAESVEIVDYH